MQQGGPHLGADALALVSLAKPGPGADFAQDGEIGRRHALRADYGAVADGDEVKRPVLRLPGPRCDQWYWSVLRARSAGETSVHGNPNGCTSGSCTPAAARLGQLIQVAVGRQP